MRFFLGVNFWREFLGKDHRSSMLWWKIDLIYGTEDSIFREGACFCFVLFSFLLPSGIIRFYFAFVSSFFEIELEFETHYKKPLVHKFIEIKPSHTVKMALDYECWGSVSYYLARCSVLSKTNWLKNLTPSSVILSDISMTTILIPAIFLSSVKYGTRTEQSLNIETGLSS